MKIKANVMDADTMKRTLMRISHEIIAHNKGIEDLCLVGIRSRGMPLAEVINNNIQKIEGSKIPCGCININFYRDDLSKTTDLPSVKECSLDFSIENKNVILVDDVLYTGRTARAAIEALFSLGRPKTIQLAVLIDRGHRELPIRPDYVGKNIPTSKSEIVKVMVPPFDDVSGVVLL